MKWKNLRLACYIILLSIQAGYASTNHDSTPPLRVVSWNLQWLTNRPIDDIAESRRTAADITAMQSLFKPLNASIVAFQEVNDFIALSQVIGHDYHVIFSDRKSPLNQRHQFDDINQFTGVAIDRRIPFSDPSDLRLDNNDNSKLRFATYVILYPTSAHPIHLLSIHLKAGCKGKYQPNRSACRKLKQQTDALNTWIRVREQRQQRYLIVGDFNHNLSYRKDWQWRQLSQHSNATLITRNTEARCEVRSNKGHGVFRYRNLIDHVVASEDMVATDAYQAVYPTEKVLTLNLTDHCPVVVTFSG